MAVTRMARGVESLPFGTDEWHAQLNWLIFNQVLVQNSIRAVIDGTAGRLNSRLYCTPSLG